LIITHDDYTREAESATKHTQAKLEPQKGGQVPKDTYKHGENILKTSKDKHISEALYL